MSERPVEARFATPWGEGAVAVQGGRLVGVELPPVREAAGTSESAGATRPEDARALERWTAELEAYFRGERLSWRVSDLAIEDMGLTPFARRIVATLMEVPAGSTVSYGELAAQAGCPRAARAAGSVMACNNIPIVIPCHRVIRSDGSLGRYGTDPSWKKRLLDHEREAARRSRA